MPVIFAIFMLTVFVGLPYLMARLACFLLAIRHPGLRWAVFALMVWLVMDHFLGA